MITCHKLPDVTIVITEIGYTTLHVWLDNTQVQFACSERNINHIDSILDNHRRRTWCYVCLERSFSCKVKLTVLYGCTIEIIPFPPEVEVKVISHIVFTLAGASNNILLGIFIVRPHIICLGFRGIDVEITIRFIHYLPHTRNRHGVDCLIVDVVQQYDTVACKTKTFRKRNVHTGRDGLSSH